MGKLKSKSSFNDTGGRSSGDITAQNYLDRAVSFAEMNGGEAFIIRTSRGSHGSIMTGHDRTDAQWHAWLLYFEAKGVKTAFLVSRGMGTVPCEWPEDFNFSAPRSDRLWSSPLVPREATRDYSPAVSAKFSQLVRSNGAYQSTAKRRINEEVIEAQRAVEIGFPGFDGPIVPSDRLRASISRHLSPDDTFDLDRDDRARADVNAALKS